MKLLIFGGTGFIGRNLIPVLLREGFEVVLFSRSSNQQTHSYGNQLRMVSWDTLNGDAISEHFSGLYGVINLAGANIGDKLWTSKQKSIILSSRTRVTGIISGIIQKSNDKPEFIIQGSAVGYYGSRPGKSITEKTDKGQGFLSDVVDAWEKAIDKSLAESSQVVFIRTGVVLGKEGGLLPKLLLPYKFFAGGYPGKGNQWLPWIHIQDVVAAIVFLIKLKGASGIYNLASPEPGQMKTFFSEISKIIKKPTWLSVPEFVFKLLPGGMGNDLILTSQKVIPSRLVGAGFQFSFPDFNSALIDLLVKKK